VNPDFFTMAATAKDAGCRVGTTTNGMLLDDEKISRLVDRKVELVNTCIARIANGKFMESWCTIDELRLMQQLGIFPKQ